MRIKIPVREIIRKCVYLVGCMTLALITLVVMMSIYTKIDSALTQNRSMRHISQGYVEKKCYNNTDFWYSTWTIGKYSITKRNGGSEEYYIKVVDGENTDFWTVSEEEWNLLSVGDYVKK